MVFTIEINLGLVRHRRALKTANWLDPETKAQLLSRRSGSITFVLKKTTGAFVNV